MVSCSPSNGALGINSQSDRWQAYRGGLQLSKLVSSGPGALGAAHRHACLPYRLNVYIAPGTTSTLYPLFTLHTKSEKQDAHPYRTPTKSPFHQASIFQRVSIQIRFHALRRRMPVGSSCKRLGDERGRDYPTVEKSRGAPSYADLIETKWPLWPVHRG